MKASCDPFLELASSRGQEFSDRVMKSAALLEPTGRARLGLREAVIP
jgi:hypothetical protein